MDNVALRAIEYGDLEQLLTWRNDPKNLKHFREYRPLTWDHQEKWFLSLTDNRQTQMFAITHEDKLKGACGLVNIDWIARSAEVSIYIGDGYIDYDICPVAMQLLMDYGFKTLGLNRLWAEAYSFDVIKFPLLMNRGFKTEVTKRQAHWDDGWFDSLIYGKLKE